MMHLLSINVYERLLFELIFEKLLANKFSISFSLAVVIFPTGGNLTWDIEVVDKFFIVFQIFPFFESFDRLA